MTVDVGRSRPKAVSKIVVTGANGSVGRNLVPFLLESGHPTVALVRSERAAEQIPAREGLDVRTVSYDDAPGLMRACEGATAIVHLAGILFESRTSTYETGNVASARAVADAAAASGIRHLILVSVLQADAATSNRFLRSKGEAEAHVAASGVSATILRTPILLGPGTAGSAALLREVRSGAPRLLGGGRHILRPLDVADLSRAIGALCAEAPDRMRTLDLVGPEPVSYRMLLERTAALMGRQIVIRETPVWLAKAGATVASLFRGEGITPDVIDVITASEVVEDNADADLGVTLTPLAVTLQRLASGTTIIQ